MSTLSGVNSSATTSPAAGIGATAHAQRPRKPVYDQPAPVAAANNSGGTLMQSMSQALTQMGVSLPADNAQSAASGQSSQVPQAMGKLMHDLMSAVKQQESSAGQSQGAYGSDFSSALKNLISQLQNGSDNSGANASLAQLNTDFNALLGAAKSQSGATPSNSAEAQNLQTFLQNLQANLAASGTPKTGGLIGASA